MGRYRIIIVSALLILGIFMLPLISLSDKGHQYINGRLEYIKGNVIGLKVIDEKKEFPIAPKVRYLKHVEENKAIYEKPASQNDIKEGMSVTIKVVEGMVEEIILEEYRR
jgi:hypothetical protein